MSIYIGTSGWTYPHWKECFYNGIRRTDWLPFYAEKFSTVEVNGTFYRLQNSKTLQKWYNETPAEFRFAIKANRYLTHNKKLIDPERSIQIEKDHALALQDKLAVVLWQLPHSVSLNMDRLSGFVQALKQWPEARHAIEFRHPSWFIDETADCLIAAGISVCLSDAGDWPLWGRVTSDLIYIRLHGRPVTYATCYTQEALQQWAERIDNWLGQDKQVYVYFDNDSACAAPINAGELQWLLQENLYKKGIPVVGMP